MNALWNALQKQGVHSHLIAVLRYIHTNARSVIQLGKAKIAINIERGVRQGDPLSPKLFTATLEHIFRRLSWATYGLSINGYQLTNLRFADDVVLIAKIEAELQEMIDELDQRLSLPYATWPRSSSGRVGRHYWRYYVNYVNASNKRDGRTTKDEEEKEKK
ncbi:hypothetical protein OESDEN_02277 [Oesophagostomum dentatum]|uniref:Reverse transcriptase domain-containing protein n=1 Tax=Oesophagostomum dentatum TaxID=61180 RepID=A0A0B1TKI1_OESDE|nr:hypothetical protein OESDEN_02277 [Oesophagostomum dentatum]